MYKIVTIFRPALKTSLEGSSVMSYQEPVALGEQETVDPALAARLHTLLTTPFVNNEAYFNEIKPLRRSQ